MAEVVSDKADSSLLQYDAMNKCASIMMKAEKCMTFAIGTLCHRECYKSPIEIAMTFKINEAICAKLHFLAL